MISDKQKEMIELSDTLLVSVTFVRMEAFWSRHTLDTKKVVRFWSWTLKGM